VSSSGKAIVVSDELRGDERPPGTPVPPPSAPRGTLAARLQALHAHWTRWLLLALALVMAWQSVGFATRAYGSALLLRSAYELGAPEVAQIRPWMTLRYLADTYRVPEAALVERLGLEPETGAERTLRALARERRLDSFHYVQRAQEAIAAIGPSPLEPEEPATGWTATLRDELLGALLVYGYPALALTLLVGAATGLPLPTGLSTTVAGSLVAQGSMTWLAATAVAVVASVVGDVVGYGFGRVVSEEVLERRGRWLGYTPARRERLEELFQRFGALTVLLSRTLVSHLSSVVNVLAGIGRYRPWAFLAVGVLGRLLWTTAYLGLGYGIAGGLEHATELLRQLTGLLITLAIAAGLAHAATRRPRHA
jgi:membrane-associated protein